MGENKMREIFYNDATIEQYEVNEQWDECVLYLYALVMKDVENKKLWFSLAAQSWYTLTFWECYMKKENSDRQKIENYFMEAYTNIQQHWGEDANSLWLCGYFMCINPYEFLFLDMDISDIELRGNELINRAYIIDASNPLVEVLFVADNGKKKYYIEAKKRLRTKIKDFFPSNSLIDRYFTEIFTTL